MMRRAFRAWCRPATLGLLVAGLLVPVPAVSQSPARVLAWVAEIRGPEDAPLRWPVGVAAAPDGRVAVADAFGSRVLLFTRTGGSWQMERSVDLPGVPAGLTHDGSAFVVSLRGDGGLLRLDSTGGVPRRLTLPADVVPGALASSADGSLLVFDEVSNRVLELAESGEVRRAVDLGPRVTALASGSKSGFFAAVPDQATILTVDGEGVVRESWTLEGADPKPAWPTGIVVEPGGDVLVSDRHGHRILVFDATGRWIGLGSGSGWEPGLLRFPGALARLPTGELVVADQGNARVQVFRRSDQNGG